MIILFRQTIYYIKSCSYGIYIFRSLENLYTRLTNVQCTPRSGTITKTSGSSFIPYKYISRVLYSLYPSNNIIFGNPSPAVSYIHHRCYCCCSFSSLFSRHRPQKKKNAYKNHLLHIHTHTHTHTAPPLHGTLLNGVSAIFNRHNRMSA